MHAMPEPDKRTYKKLAGPTLGLFEPISLHAGEDHLLLVHRWLFWETYRRFYYRDIQALLIRRTNTVILAHILLLTAVGMLLLIGISGEVTHWSYWALVGAVGAWEIVNIARGWSCQAHLKTAASLQGLSCLGRLRAAERFSERLAPYIRAAQGDAPAEQIAEQWRRLRAAPPPRPGEPSPFPRLQVPPAGAFQPKTPRPYGGKAHRALCGALLGGGLAFSLHAISPSASIGIVISLLALLTQLGLSIWAVSVQTNTTLPAGLRKAAIAALVYVVCLFAAGTVSLPFAVAFLFEDVHAGGFLPPAQVLLALLAVTSLALGILMGVQVRNLPPRRPAAEAQPAAAAGTPTHPATPPPRPAVQPATVAEPEAISPREALADKNPGGEA